MASQGQMNLLGDDWSLQQNHGDYRWRRMRVAGDKLGASVYELEPGTKTWPYHYELGNEELLVVVSGHPTLRSPDGERELVPGDAILFPEGPEGAHQVSNRSETTARVLIVSNFALPRAAVQVDSQKITVRWSGEADDTLEFRLDDAADYWEGEE